MRLFEESNKSSKVGHSLFNYGVINLELPSTTNQLEESDEKVFQELLKEVDKAEQKRKLYKDWQDKQNLVQLNLDNKQKNSKLERVFWNFLGENKLESSQIINALKQTFSKQEPNNPKPENDAECGGNTDQGYERFEMIKRNKKAAQYLGLYDINDWQLLTMINLKKIENELKAKKPAGSLSLFNHQIWKEMDQKKFKNALQEQKYLSDEVHEHLSEIDQAKVQILIDQFNNKSFSKKIWEKSNNFLPNYSEWSNQRGSENKGELIAENKKKFELSSRVQEKFKYGKYLMRNSFYQEISKTNRHFSIEHDDSDMKILVSKISQLNKHEQFLEYLVQVPEEIINEIKEVQRLLIESQSKLKKNVAPKEQVIVEAYEDIEFFKEVTDYSYLQIKLQFSTITGFFSSYFNFQDFIDEPREFFTQFMQEKHGVQSKRRIGFNLYFPLENGKSIRILPDGNILYKRSSEEFKTQLITPSCDIVSYETIPVEQKEKSSPLLPSLTQTVNYQIYEEPVKGKPVANKKEQIQQEVVEIKVEEPVKQLNKDIISVKKVNGEEMIFNEGLWETRREDGTIEREDNLKKEKINSFARSYFPTQQYPKMVKREDEYFSLHISSTQMVRKFADGTFLYINEDEIQIQKEGEEIFNLKNKSQLRKWFSEEFLSDFETNFFEFQLENKRFLKLLKKKQNKGFLVLLDSEIDLILIDEEGCMSSIPLEKINRIEQEVLMRKYFKLKLQYLHKQLINLVSMMSRLDEKFEKTKKKKNKDKDRHEEQKKELKQEFLEKIRKAFQKIEEGNSLDVSSAESLKETEEHQQEIKSVEDSVVFSEENYPCQLNTIQEILEEYENLKKIENEQQQTPSESQEQIDIFKIENQLLEEMARENLTDLNSKLLFYIQRLRKNSEFLLEETFLINLKNSTVEVSDCLQRRQILDIQSSIFQETIDLSEIQEVLGVTQPSHTSSNELQQDQFNQVFQEFSTVLFDSRTQFQIFMEKEGRFFQLFSSINTVFYEKVSQGEVDVFFKTANRNPWHFKARNIKSIEVEEKIDLFEEEIKKKVFTENVDDLLPRDMHFKYKCEITEEEFEKKLSEFDEWSQVNQTANNYFGFIPVPDKKKKVEIVDHNLYDLKKLLQIEKKVTQREPLISQEKICQIFKDHVSIQNTINEARGLQKIFQNVIKVTKTMNKIKSSVQKRAVKKDDDRSLKLSTCFIASNYFDSYRGRKFLKENPLLIQQQPIAREERQIIESLIQTGTQIQKRSLEKAMDSGENDLIREEEIEIPEQARILNVPKHAPSYQTQIDQKNLQLYKEQQLKLEQQRIKKTKEFDVYGNQRQNLPKVPSLYKTTELMKQKNTKYIEVESEVERRVKTCSMANKIYMKADTINTVRNFAPHKILLKSIDKAYPSDYVMFKKCLNPIAEYHDSSIKDLIIYPSVLDFGNIKTESYYQVSITVVNDDSMSQRIKLRSPKTHKEFSVISEQGPIAPGMKRKVIIQLDTKDLRPGKFEAFVEILSKRYLYKIPLIGVLISRENFEAQKDKDFREPNMFVKKQYQIPLEPSNPKELSRMDQTSKENTVQNYETSLNIPKLNYDEKMNLTLTRQTHKFSDQESKSIEKSI